MRQNTMTVTNHFAAARRIAFDGFGASPLKNSILSVYLETTELLTDYLDLSDGES